MLQQITSLVPEEKKIRNFTLYVLGIMLFAVSCMSLLCFLPFVISERLAVPMIIISLIGIAGSVALFMFIKPVRKAQPAVGIVTIALAGLLATVYMTIPYLLSGFTFVDSVFEAISGFSTTGLSTIHNFDTIDSSLLLWRSMTGWIGAMFFVIVFTLLMPLFGLAGRYLFSTESTSFSESQSFKVKKISFGFLKIYIAITAILAVILTVLGNGLLDSICISMSTISTTGFATSDTELIEFNFLSKVFITIGMILSSVNFITTYRAVILRSFRPYREDSELRQLAVWIVCMTAIIFVIVLRMDMEVDSVNTLVDALFTITSIGSTTGFIFGDIVWPEGVLLLFVIIAIVGGSTDSFTGGLKISRLMIIFSTIYINIMKYAFPNRVMSVKYNETEINNNIISSSIITLLIFVLTIGIGTGIFLMLGVDTGSSLAFSVSSLTTVGTGLFSLGNTALLTDSVKIVICVLMWIGRMEIFLVLVLFTPSLWKDLFGNWMEKFRRKANGMHLRYGSLLDFPGRRR